MCMRHTLPITHEAAFTPSHLPRDSLPPISTWFCILVVATPKVCITTYEISLATTQILAPPAHVIVHPLLIDAR